jgi:predicted DNA-binding protein (MmcQ/YjbR family)
VDFTIPPEELSMPGSIARIREICLALPEAVEKPFGGHTDPAFRVRDKIFAVVSRPFEHVSLTCKGPPGAQEILIGSDAERYFRPPYTGHRGWVGVRLDLPIDWPIVEDIIRDSYRMTAPKRLANLVP